MVIRFLNIIFCFLITCTSFAQAPDKRNIHFLNPESDNTNHTFKIVNAYYKSGKAAFYEKIKQLISPSIEYTDYKHYEGDLEVTGEVSAKGEILGLTYKSNIYENMAKYLVSQMMLLPNLEPALLDGKPVPQGIVFKFRFQSGLYRFGYELLPLNDNN